jgi:hypothetical protein
MPTTRRRRGRGRAGLSDALAEYYLTGQWPRNDDGTRPLGRLQLFPSPLREIDPLVLS